MLAPSTFEGKPYVFETDHPPATVPAWVPRKDQPKLSERAAPRSSSITLAATAATTMAEVREALSYISADLAYDEWVGVLMALHDKFGADGLQLADQWSSTGNKYKPGEVTAKFAGFKPGGGVTIKRVFKLAKDNGCNSRACPAASYRPSQRVKKISQ